MLKHKLLTFAFVAAGGALLAATPKFPGFKSTDRQALLAAAEKGDKLTQLRARVRLAQIDTPEKTATYAKQSQVVRAEMEKLGLTDAGLVFTMPLATPAGKVDWCKEGWHAAHKAGDHREMMYLVNTADSVNLARAELGDAGLFRRYALLLKRHFGKYSPPVVNTALTFMSRLTKAVDPVDVVTDLSQIRARIRVKAEKAPGKWGKALEEIDKMIAEAEAEAAAAK